MAQVVLVRVGAVVVWEVLASEGVTHDSLGNMLNLCRLHQ